MKTIACIGCGTVGYATCLALSSLGHAVVGIDTSMTARNALAKKNFPCFSPNEVMLEGQLNCSTLDAVLIALPTPFCPTRKELVDDAIMSSVELIGHLCRQKQDNQPMLIILKSTVSVGTSRKLFRAIQTQINDDDCQYQLFYHPEFLRAANNEQDALHPIKQVFGYVGGKPHMPPSSCQPLLEQIFSPAIGMHRAPIVMMSSSEEAEYLKIAHNFSNALRISFSNCVAQVAATFSTRFEQPIDGARILSIISDTAESFYNNKYGIEPGYPYGGACLVKDVQYLMNAASEEPYRQFIQLIHVINEEEKKQQNRAKTEAFEPKNEC